MPGALNKPEVTTADDGGRSLRLPFHIQRRQGAILLEPEGTTPTSPTKVDPTLVRAVVLAKRWAAQLEAGELGPVKALARANGLCNHNTARLLPLAYLVPEIVESILAGNQPRAVSLASLTAEPLPLTWSAQRDLIDRLGR